MTVLSRPARHDRLALEAVVDGLSLGFVPKKVAGILSPLLDRYGLQLQSRLRSLLQL